MNEIKIFTNDQFGKIRTITKDGEPWFAGKDVADVLGYSNQRDALRKHVDEEDKGVAKCDTPGGKQEITFINESGLYSLTLSSKLPSAKAFKRWITHEVIPAIRKHGMYATPEMAEQILNDPDTMIRVLQELKDERQKRLDAEETNRKNEPKVLFADSVAHAENEILVGELAKLMRQNGYETGRDRLFEQLRQDGYIMKGKCEPTQRAMEMGLFRIIERTIDTPDGSRLTRTTKVTGKGQIFFINKYVGKRDLVDMANDPKEGEVNGAEVAGS